MCQHFLVAGQVQGVAFRYSTVQQARKLGLVGWVRNRRDGAVELVACGAASALDELERWLWQGPPAARVTAVTRSAAAVETFSDFEIR